MDCLQLELNECEENEYRCHNGMCVPEEFFNDHPYNPDCLDGTDENNFDDLKLNRALGFIHCYQDPSFLCEESDLYFGLRGFVCGDGQNIKMHTEFSMGFDMSDYLQCENGRDTIMLQSAVLEKQRSSNLTSECIEVMKYIMQWDLYSLSFFHSCKNKLSPCSFPIHTFCNHSTYVFFPILPFLQEYGEFGFWTNTVITIDNTDRMLLPDFICFNENRCPFLKKDFLINNMSCSNLSIYELYHTRHLIGMFHTCLSVDKSGNETTCFYSSMFHCSNTSKCISKHRLVDQVIDCFKVDDEFFENSCKLNDKYRFQCSFQDMCIAPVLIHNANKNCIGGEDEMFDSNKTFSFQNICNGYTQLSPVIVNEEIQTDETNCEQWPCSNQYTQCNGAWECPDGADEVNCDRTSICDPNHHLCVSPINFEIMCLPINQAGDGKIDCIGSTDEREFCRRENPENHLMRYRCWNSTICTVAGCMGTLLCPFEQHTSAGDICRRNSDIEQILESPALDYFLGSKYNRVDVYFILGNISRFKSSVPHANLAVSNEPNSTRIGNILTDHIDSSLDEINANISFYEGWICNRGILLFEGLEKIERCLCPPSYYGNRCQFQSQRVSLTLQLSKECAPTCHGIYNIIVTLIDDHSIIHSYEQITYISTSNCDIKYNMYLLFQTRPKNLEKNYSIRIDVYNKIDLIHYTSWILPIKFIFLPVNRISAHLIIPSHPVNNIDTCKLICNNHGRCSTYSNRKEDFCICNSGWSGANCSIRLDACNCSPDAKCLGEVNNRSICLCPQTKFGPRCFRSSICRNNPCKNNGQCITENEQISMNSFKCICTSGFSGSMCQIKNTRVDISFQGVNIPSAILVHFITVQNNSHPLISTISKKISFDEDSTTLYISMPFNLIFIQTNKDYYLAFSQTNSLFSSSIQLEMNSFQHCISISDLLDERTVEFHILRRVKFYHKICREKSSLSCFYDKEAFMCLCNNDQSANCFPFDFNKLSVCRRRTRCENDGQCIEDRAICPESTMCICTECFYGGKCQFTTKGFSLSLDVILGYQIRPHLSINRQSIVVKVSIILTTFMFLIGLANGFLSIITFHSKNLCQTGCGLYLFASSIVSLICSFVFILKFWFLLLSQISWSKYRPFILLNCILMDFILQSLLTIENWLSACVAIERVFILGKGPYFNKKKSKKVAKWVIFAVILYSLISLIYDPIHRQLIDDEEELRTWCAVRYSSHMKTFDSFINIFNFIIPFSINIISAIIIVVSISRSHSTKNKTITYRDHLRKQFYECKHLIISPFVLIILGIPRLIISFFSGCMKSARDPWLFLFAYFISFIPPLLTFIIFVCPSQKYKNETLTIFKRRRILSN